MTTQPMGVIGILATIFVIVGLGSRYTYKTGREIEEVLKFDK